MNEAKAKNHGGLTLAIDYGPLLAFFAAFKLSGIFVGTGVFMAATAVAVAVSKWKLGRVSPMLWLSAILIGGFGALTLWLHDENIIKYKPTAIYSGLGVLLLAGVALGRPLLKVVLEAGFEGLSERGWMTLSRNWGVFFLFMAGLNEVMWRNLSTDMWLTLKVWALIPLSVGFGIAHVPYMMKQGLGTEAEPEVPPAS